MECVRLVILKRKEFVCTNAVKNLYLNKNKIDYPIEKWTIL